MNIRQILIPVTTLLICVGIISKWTHGFKAFTIFSYTLEEAHPLSKTFPDIRLVDHTGKVFNIHDKDKYLLVNFVYLNCPDVCHKVNNQLEELYHLPEAARVIPDKLNLLTISFDQENDNVAKIEKYRSYFGKDIDAWSFALPYQFKEEDFFDYLKSLGVWIYKNPDTGIINHSVNLYLISPDHKIVRIFDPGREKSKSIIKQIEQCIDGL